ncbi:MAG: helix-hairpin-helix domain-containing protein [Nitrospirae bacterium]|nr:MAG: helix-hairpin-helix domain-containing protein [Nitrospirota bacterium]
MLRHLFVVLFLLALAAPPALAAEGGHRIHLNTATAEELEALPGIGPVLAERIVRYRADHGPFTTVEELRQVKGVGERLLERLAADLDL